VSASPFDHPLLWRLLGDDEVARHLTAAAELEHMLAFERALTAAEGEEGIVPEAAADDIVARLADFTPDTDRIAEATARDGVVGVEYVRQLREWVGAPNDKWVHFGATSQDLVDTALVLRLRPIIAALTGRLTAVATRLAELSHAFGARELMGRTRMQNALPIRVSDRIAAWRAPLLRHVARIEEIAPRLFVLQLGGAVGTLDKLGDKAAAVAARVANKLDLAVAERAWHTQRDSIAEFAGWLSLITGSLGKIGADVALMAQAGSGEIVLRQGGGSSAMPHKSNPVAAEVLVSLAHFNATLVSGMHAALIHEQERSGSAWTLEWLVLPQMIMSAAAALRSGAELVSDIESLGREN
jgi:3-carboxy-cis,cis-muconate cycloisomerase